MSARLVPFRRDAALYGFIAGYGLLVWTVAQQAGVPGKFQPFSYTAAWLILGVQALPVLLGITALLSLRSEQPLAAIRLRLQRLGRPEVLNGLILATVLSVFSGLFTSAKSMLPDLVPFHADPALAAIDAAVPGSGIWQLAWQWPGLLRWAEFLYFPGWSALFFLSLAGAVFWPRLQPVRAQFLWTYLLTWSLLGNLVAGAAMSAGPIFLERVTGDASYRQLADLVGAHMPLTSAVRDWLWSNHQQAGAAPAIGISAFPSLHLAQSTLFVLLAQAINRPLAWAALAFGAAIFVGSVSFGWHYAIDGWFSIGATLVLWKLVGRVLAWRDRPKGAAPVSFGGSPVPSATAGSPAS